MSQVFRKQVSFHKEKADHLEGLFRSAEDMVIMAESALATAVLEMAEAVCKGHPKPEYRLWAVQLAYRDAVKNLSNLRTALPPGAGQRSSGAGVKSERKPSWDR